MKLEISIETKSKKQLLKEIDSIKSFVELELKSPMCKGCKSCKDFDLGCYVGGGSYNPKPFINSQWKLNRNYSEHKSICKSKQKK